MFIKSFYKDYSVIFDDNFSNIDDLVIIDKNVYNLYPDKFKNVILFEAKEEYKNINSSIKICEQLLEKNIKKNSKVTVIGGGITQDVCGFAMNILFRGLNWTFIPTTLLAQADSCIGSKTSLNLNSYKNIVGTFYPPSKIIINCEFLKTLSDKDYFSGIGEVVKLHLIGGVPTFKAFNNSVDKIINKDLLEIKKLISQCLEIKKQFIEQDELDLNRRQTLNFGHTFGHAIESETNYEIPHGIAVILGIILANKISNKIGLLSNDTTKDIYEVLINIIKQAGFNSNIFQTFNKDNLIQKTKKDKKNTNDSNLNMILMNNSFEFEKTPVNLQELKHII